MLNPTEVLARALGKELAATYRRAFSGVTRRSSPRQPGSFLSVSARAMRSIILPSIPPLLHWLVRIS
jgi:hypothetical protein